MTTMTTTTTIPQISTNPAPPLQITKRPWNARGHADHGWLYTFHTFPFAAYHDAPHESFGPLRVINEDTVAARTGFGTHGHAEFLIWSYILAGELEHRDSMGNVETLGRGAVQFTSAGTGIRHSEQNRHPDTEAHFLQIWARPAVRGLTPSYRTRKYPDALKVERLLRIMESTERCSKEGEEEEEGETGPIPLHADLSMSASILSPGRKVVHELVAEGERKVYLHVAMMGRKQPESGGAKIRVRDTVLGEGDGAFVEGAVGPGKIEIESVGDRPVEFLLFDMRS